MTIHSRRMSWGVALALVLASGLVVPGARAQGFDYVTCDGTNGDCPTFPINPNAPFPNKGASFADPNYHTTVTRLSDQGVDGINCNELVINYPTIGSENADHSRVLVTCQSFNQYLYNANTFEFIKPLNMPGKGHNPEPIWDRNDPNIIYYRSEARFYKYDIRTDASTLIHDFTNEYPGAEAVVSETKGEPSMDGRYWAFKVRGGCCPVVILDWIIYDKQTDTIRSWNNSPAGQNNKAYHSKWVGMSPSGQYFVWKNAAGPSYVAPADFSSPGRQLASNSHSDFVLDKNGKEVYVAKQTGAPGIAMAYLDNPGNYINLMPLDGNWEFHVSGNNYDTPGWALISHYNGMTQDNWKDFAIYMVELDPNKCMTCAEKPIVWRIAQTFNAWGSGGGIDDYWKEAQATISRDGMAVYWASNWWDASRRNNVYKATLPPTWFEDLSSDLPTEPPPPPSSLTIVP